MDVGSLNGTRLNDRPISRPNRQPGTPTGLADGDELLLGTQTRIKIIVSSLLGPFETPVEDLPLKGALAHCTVELIQ